MLVFGYPYEQGYELGMAKPIPFSEHEQARGQDVVIFSPGHGCVEEYEAPLIFDIVEKARKVIFISTSNVYGFSLFPHKEGRESPKIYSVDGMIETAFETTLLDYDNVIVFRVDTVLEPGVVDIIVNRIRLFPKVKVPLFQWVTLIQLKDLFIACQRAFDTFESLKYRIYNIGKATMNLRYLYKKLTKKPFKTVLFGFSNNSLNTKRAEKEGLL